jgi:hypothetical protein
MEFDNNRDRFEHGFDAGSIVDGIVEFNEELNRFVVIDNDGVGFDPQVVLQQLVGKKVRITMVSFEAIENLEKLIAENQL